MRIIFFLFINTLMLVIPAFALGEYSHREVSSQIAVSQSGRFTINYHTPLIVDNKGSSGLTNFIAYQDPVTKNQLFIGAIPGEQELNLVCKNPVFLRNEKIDDVAIINDNEIYYFNANQYKGCLINFFKNKSAIIIEIPKPFVSQDGEKIKHIGIVSNIEDINKLKTSISFHITAKDFFINLLQLSQAFSPFSNEINWDAIKNKGIEFIGNETKTCRGLSAAATFLTPALNKVDSHSFITLNGLGTPSCPVAPLPEDESMKKWFSIPEATRSTIIKYSSNFHGYELNRHIAYLYIPAMDAFDPDTINKKITSGRETLTKVNIDKSCGLIIDLRFNTGGSVVPMLLTLGGVMSGGKLFSLEKTTPIYLSEDGNKLFMHSEHDIYGQYAGAIPNRNNDKPIVILTNWMTGSSGAMTRLALRDNAIQAKVFGTKTSPTASINATFYLLDGNTFNLMVGRLYNKNGMMVPLELPVDKEVVDNLQAIFDPNADIALNAAKEWLESLPICSK